MRLKITFVSIITINLLTISFCQKSENVLNNDPDEEIPVPEGYALIWNDEFSGSEIDMSKWEHEVNAKGGGNNELQYYTDRKINSYVEDDALIIQALKEQYTGSEGTRSYTSARLRTKKKGDWRYGRFEIRTKLPFGKGLWPAIWMLPTDWKYGGWAASGEIDIMELVGHEPNKVYGTLHYGGAYPNNTHSGDSYTLPEGDFSDDFHTFTLDWDTTQFQWYVDDVFYLSQTSWYTENHPYPAPFDQFFHILLNVAVGGNFPGNPDASTIFPQRMYVDYVRVFKKIE